MPDLSNRLRVADFPRPPALEREPRRITITLGGVLIADTSGAWRVLETTHPPAYYLPPDAFIASSLTQGSDRFSVCEWKGRAHYLTLVGGGRQARDAGWAYAEPISAFAPIRDHVAVYPGRVDRCTVGEDLVTPQPGGFYGGWITPDLIGPFKGAPGTEWW